MESSVSITLSPRLEKFLKANWIPGVCEEGLAEVAKEETGDNGILAEHFASGQTAWPETSAKWKRDARKGDPRKFVSSGKTLAAITQDLSAIDAELNTSFFGSSADAGADVSARAIQATSKGLYVRIRQNRDGASLSVGFVGEMRHSTKFKKMLYKGRQRIFAGKTGETMRDMAKRAGANAKGRKWAARGSKGFTLRAGKQKFQQAGEKDNLAYANILQRGEHKGIQTRNSRLTPQQVGHLKRLGRDVRGSVVTGQKRPLVPAKSSDSRRINIAFNRGLERTMKRMGF